MFIIVQLSKVLYIKANDKVTQYTLKLINLIPSQSHSSSCVSGIKIIFEKNSYPTEVSKLYTIDVIK